MAVQAQRYQSPNAFPDFRTSPAANAWDGLQTHLQIENPLGPYNYQVSNGAAMQSELESELTCIASGSRKRAREEAAAMLPDQQPNHTPQRFRLATVLSDMNEKTLYPIPTPMISAGLQLSGDPNRLHGSAGTSTSGRPLVSPLGQDLVTLLYNQNLEIDTLVRFQSESLRTGMEEARKRHGRALLASVAQLAAKRLTEMELELESASQRNVELEDRVRQVSAETQIWFSVARNNEAVVSSLRAALEQALHNNAQGNAGSSRPVREGFGDSEGALFPADDAQSCCFEQGTGGGGGSGRGDSAAEAVRERVEQRRRGCRACHVREVCVLVLPCRHLCLCKGCEHRLDTCPACGSPKSGSLQVFMS